MKRFLIAAVLLLGIGAASAQELVWKGFVQWEMEEVKGFSELKVYFKEDYKDHGTIILTQRVPNLKGDEVQDVDIDLPITDILRLGEKTIYKSGTSTKITVTKDRVHYESNTEETFDMLFTLLPQYEGTTAEEFLEEFKKITAMMEEAVQQLDSAQLQQLDSAVKAEW